MQQPSTLDLVRRTLLYVSIGLLTLSALLAIVAVLSGELDWRIIVTTFFAALASVLAMGNVSRLGEPQPLPKFLSFAALLFNVVWLVLALSVVWDFAKNIGLCSPSYYGGCGDDTQSQLIKWSVTMFVAALVSSLTAKFLTIKGTTPAIISLKVLTIVSAVMCGTTSLFIIWQEYGNRDDSWRILTVFGILTIFGLVVTPILVRLQKPKARPGLSSEDEQRLRQEIEQEVRAKIADEQRAQEVGESQ